MISQSTIIRNIRIEKLWGSRDVLLPINHDINFLIGVNGSGKTTVINLVAATLNVDLYTLKRFEYRKIFIDLQDLDSKRNIEVTVENLFFKRNSQPKLKFSINNYLDTPISHEFPFEYIDDVFRHMRFRRQRSSGHIPRIHPRRIQDTMDNIVQLRWLPVNRSARDFRSFDENDFSDSIERRLYDQASRLSDLFLTLGTTEKEFLSEFQKKIFSSLIQQIPQQHELFSQLRSIDLQSEKETLTAIFKEFDLYGHRDKVDLERHFRRLESLQQKIDKNSVSIEFEEFATIFQQQSAHFAVEEWNIYCEKREILYKSANIFQEIFNELVINKTMSISKNNKLEFKTVTGKILTAEELSSGEKQLLILLSEVLLQNNKTWVYIADEPELSLHVRWQDQLVRSIRLLNSDVQIIFATHSPDIVGIHQSKIINMEEKPK